MTGCSILADGGIVVSDVGLSGAPPDTALLVTWTDSKRRDRTFAESWALYDGGYPGGVPGTTILTPPDTIASVVFSNILD